MGEQPRCTEKLASFWGYKFRLYCNPLQCRGDLVPDLDRA
eukprot:SAG31_NODE_47097_length_251_cov_1.368421_1_plen_39_part_10